MSLEQRQAKVKSLIAREWETRAESMLHLASTTRLQSFQDLLAEADTIVVEPKVKVEALVNDNQSWLHRAQRCLEGPTITDFEALLTDFAAIPSLLTKDTIETAEVIRRQLERASHWLKRVSNLSTGSANIPFRMMLALIRDGREQPLLEVTRVLAELDQRLQQHLRWRCKFADCLYHGAAEEVDVLMQENGTGIDGSALKLRMSEMLWEKRASKVVGRKSSMREVEDLCRERESKQLNVDKRLCTQLIELQETLGLKEQQEHQGRMKKTRQSAADTPAKRRRRQLLGREASIPGLTFKEQLAIAIQVSVQQQQQSE